MPKKILFLLTCWCLFSAVLIAKANNTAPRSATDASRPPCVLPAPGNIQYTQLTPTTVKFTFDTVPGAVAYRGVLVNVGNGAQAVMVGVADNFTFAVVPGNSYIFYVACMCSLDPPEYSLNVGQKPYSAPGIVIELILKVYGCVPTGVPFYSSNSPSATVQNTWVPNDFYYFEFWKYVYVKPGQISYVKKTRIAFQRTAQGFAMGEPDTNEEPSVLCGPTTTIPPNPCAMAPATVSFAKFTFEDRTCRIAFALNGSLIYYYDAISNEKPFDYFKIFHGCNGGGEFDGGGSERTELVFESPVAEYAETASLRVSSVNPFSDQLTMFFTETPDKPVKTRLLNLQGIPQIETVIQPAELSENSWSLPTADLPAGLYFLQLETGPGEVVTQKVLKI